MGLFALLVYGIGDILGAGIYALLGKVVAETGTQAWLSFTIALTIALLTALGYAELTSRFPRSGGASHFVHRAFGHPGLSFVVGWLALSVSLVSMATLSRAFYGYLHGLGAGLPAPLVIGAFLGVVTLINLWGIRQSSYTNMVSTLVEVSGLLLVVVAGAYFLFSREGAPASPSPTSLNTLSLMEGAVLAFYAFIGFEDLANVAEESKDPERNLPIAILGSLLCAGVFYSLIAWISTSVVSPAQLASSSAPLAEVVKHSGIGVPVSIFGFVALFAVANTCLLNFITGSRLIYGMAEEKLIPSFFTSLLPKFSTPYVAILCMLPVAFTLAVLGDLSFLAGTTSVLILGVFCFSHAALLKVKWRESGKAKGFRVPIFVPALALVANLGLAAFSQGKSLLLAVLIAVFGIGIYWLVAARGIDAAE